MTKYVWSDQARQRGDAQLVGRELDRLQRLNGKALTAQVVLAEARNAKTALHACFTWDDAIAGEKWRENEARQVLRMIRVVHSNSATEEPRRVFINITGVGPDSEQAYVPMVRVLSEPELFERARKQFLSDLHAFERRYQEFEALVIPLHGVRAAIESLAMQAATQEVSHDAQSH